MSPLALALDKLPSPNTLFACLAGGDSGSIIRFMIDLFYLIALGVSAKEGGEAEGITVTAVSGTTGVL